MALSSEAFEQLKTRLGAQAAFSGTPGTSLPPPEPHALDGLGVSDRLKQAFSQRVQNTKAIRQSDQSLPSKVLQTLGESAGLVTDVGTEAVKAITPQPVEEAVSAGVQAIANTPVAQDIAAKYAAFKETHPEAAANLEATGIIASILPIPPVVGAGAKATATVAGEVVEGAGKVAAVSGRATSGAGETAFKTAITPTVEEAKRLQKFRADVPFLTRVNERLSGTENPKAPITRADTALKQGLAGRNADLGVQATRKADALYKDMIDPAVKASTVRVTKEELFAPIEARITREADPTRRASLQNAYDALKEDYTTVNDLSLDEAQALKRALAKRTPSKIFKGQEVASELRTLQADIAGAIRTKTYEALGPQYKQAYLDYGNLAELENLGVKALTDAKGKGGFGSFWTGVYDMATVPVKTVGGQVLYRVGNKLEFLGEKGLKTFGQFLKKHGYTKPSSAPSQPTRTPAK